MEQITRFVANLQAKLFSRIPPFAEDALIFIIPLGMLAFILLVVSICSAFMGFLTCLSLMVLILCFFRDPKRIVPTEPGALVSPADGTVNQIVEDQDPFSGDKRQRITIFLSVFDVHINRVPMAGTVERIKFTGDGKYLVADVDEASKENVQNILKITDGDSEVVVKQIVGLIARRIVCWAKEGDKYDRGQRFGLIRFGSRVDLLLPMNARIVVQCGDKVEGGVSVIGYLNEAAS